MKKPYLDSMQRLMVNLYRTKQRKTIVGAQLNLYLAWKRFLREFSKLF
jgi:hypothetical protein